jgi:hypothetical protein
MARLLRLTGLPELPPLQFDPQTTRRLQLAAERLLAGDVAELDDAPCSRVDFLRWLAEEERFLFHGSRRADLNVLEPIRLSRDVTAFGDQQAVYATSDPVWAIYFAVLQRGTRFSTRNGSIGIAGGGVYPRRYFFSVNASAGERFGTGSLYILPRDGFVAEPPFRGVFDTAQWVSPTAVRSLARLDVTPDDFPFRHLVVTHSDREPMLVTWAKSALRARRQRSSRR